MSVLDVDLFVPPQLEDVRHPKFPLVRKGYDPYDVLDYVAQVADRIEDLERELHRMRQENESTRDSRESAKEAAYDELADRMAELLRTAEQQADRTRTEAAEEATKRLEEAASRAEDIVREAQGGADEMRARADAILQTAREETDRILGGLADRRDGMVEELREAKTRLADVIELLDEAVSTAERQSERAQLAVAGDGTTEPDVDPEVGDIFVEGEEPAS